MTSATKRYIQDKIKARESKLLEEERLKEEARLAEIERNRPLITKDDLVGAISSLVQNSNKQIEEERLQDKAEIAEELKKKDEYLESEKQRLLKIIDELQAGNRETLASLESKIEEGNKQATEALKVGLGSIKIPKPTIPSLKDIKGLPEILEALDNKAQNVSQPITVDVLQAGVIKRSGVRTMNYTAGTIVTPTANGVDITFTGTGGANWGSIVGTLSSQTDLQTALNAKQDLLVSGTNIKTVNGVSVLGAGDIPLPNGTSINSVSADTTILITDGVTVYLVDASSGPVIITLPTPTSNTGQYTVKKIDSSSNTVQVVGVINGFISPTIDFQDESWTMISSGIEYEII